MTARAGEVKEEPMEYRLCGAFMKNVMGRW